MTSTTPRMPTAFVPHGGGPWPVLRLAAMGDDETDALASYMRSIASAPPVPPRALLVVSAHWEEEVPTVNVAPSPGLLFDYANFPEAAYELTWPASGDPALAARVADLLTGAGFEVASAAERGLDHGVFIPLLLAYPDADVPVVQLSLMADLDPERHLAVGRALAPLRDEGVYVLGSGNSFHNLRALFGGDASHRPLAEAFDRWLEETVAGPAGERAERLRRWPEAPAARACHPREEHLLPLMVAAGAAGDDRGRVAWTGTMSGFRISAHVFDGRGEGHSSS
ncbi:MAG: DODA-type extradiol aromatic ring-opening family dioxygenase [Sandaracinaceae bacterium]